ncbi:MAG: hypothetical protein WCG10_00155 [Chlamydiota bacterium]
MSTEKPRPLVGYRENQDTKKDTPVDPKKFKEELSKVQESDAAQQQGKRNLKKSEEEGEDDMGAQAPPSAPTGVFSMFMSEGSSDNLLTPKTPQNVRQTAAPTASSTFNIEEMPSDASSGMGETPPTASASPQAASAPPSAALPSSAGSSFTENIPSIESAPPQTPSAPPTSEATSTPSDTSTASTPAAGQSPTATPLSPYEQQASSQSQAPSQEQTSSTQPPSTQASPTRIQKKQTTDISLLSTKHPSSAQLIKQKQNKLLDLNLGKKPDAPPSDAPTLKTITKPIMQTPSKQPAALSNPTKALPSINQESTPQTSQAATSTPLQKAPLATTPTSTHSIIDKKTTSNAAQPVSPATNAQGLSIKTDTSSSQDQSKKQNKDQSTDNVGAQGQVPLPLVAFTPPPAEALPTYTNLPSEVYELFERMVGSITVEHTKASTTTTITLAMKGSIFDGTQIVLDRQSTSMNTFNIQIATNPQAQDLINANLTDLVAAFQGSKLAFDVNIRKPILLEKYHDFQRKDSPQKEKDQEGHS